VTHKWLLALFAATLVSSCQMAPVNGKTVSALASVPLQIRASGKTLKFRVEVARTAEEQARGLMFREVIPPGTGMIFPMDPPRPASFWMKNCPVPQDWLFIRADGTIARLIENTIPYSLESQGTSEPVAAVLELAGGEAARLGISEDDLVIWNGGLSENR
jgi:uncharacterized protein